MFTGIIEEMGNVKRISDRGRICCISIACSKILVGSQLGASIAVNGVCLTITGINGNVIDFDIMPETVHKTNLALLQSGDRVNMERAMLMNSRIDGHIVTGHVDGMGVVSSIQKEGESYLVEISCEKSLIDNMVPKGSIALDGISLTLISVFKNSFTVGLIPHTLKMTTLESVSNGRNVNLETDIIGKYVVSCLKNMRTSAGNDITWNKLAEYGY